jgi:hypothetical protein
VVRWTVRRVRGRLQAVADVPRDIPPATLALSARPTAVSLVREGAHPAVWATSLPGPVEPLPRSVTYNNGVVEVVFELEDADPVLEPVRR